MIKKIIISAIILLLPCICAADILLKWDGNDNNQIEMPDGNPLGMPTYISEDIAHWAFPPRLRNCIVNAALNDGQVPPVWGVVSGYGGGPSAYYGTHMIRLKKFSQTECSSLGCGIGFDRAELYLDSRQTTQNLANLEDEVYWFGWAVYIPSSFPHIPSRTFILSQFHVAGCLGTFPVSGQDYETAVNWDAGYTTLTATSKIRWNTDYCTVSLANGGLEEFPFPSAITFDTWHTWVIKIRPNQTNQAVSGEFKAWWDGVQYANYTGNVGRPADQGMAPLFPSIYIGNQVDDGYTAIIYYDSVKIGDKNSSYNEVFPSPGAPGDLTPPVITAFQVRATGGTWYNTGQSFPSGTNSFEIRCTTDENSTVKRDLAAVDFDVMTNTFGTTGTTAHSDTGLSCADGQTCTWHIKGEDAYGNESGDYTISWQVDTPGGGGTNLVNAQTLTNYDGDRPLQFYDGCLDDSPLCMPEETSPMQFEVDFGVEMDALRYRLFCDAVGTRVSELLDVDYWDGSTWQNFETDTDVYFTGWMETELTGIHTTKLRFTITNSVVGTVVQVRELEVFGTLYQGGGGGGVVIPASITRPTMRRVGTGPKPKIMRIR